MHTIVALAYTEMLSFIELQTAPEDFDWQFDCFYVLVFVWRGGSQMLIAVMII